MGMAPLYSASASPYYPSWRVGNAQYANRVNFQLRNATPRWSVSHDAPQAIRPAGTAGRGVYRMREPMIPVNKLSTSGIDEHWHKCADEARSVADDMKDEISKQK